MISVKMNYTNYFWKPLKLTSKNPFFWSDMHMHHDPSWSPQIWKTRGFESSDDHYFSLLSNWNNVVNYDDTAFHLGDIVFQSNGEKNLMTLFERLNFSELYLMGGNHHAGYKQLLNRCECNDGIFSLKIDIKTVYFIPNYFEIYVGKQPIVLSHYPIASWNGQGNGSWMLHGHSHGSLRNSEIGNILYRGKILDVGFENFHQPVSFNNIKKMSDKKESISFDHHKSSNSTPFS